MNDIFRTLIAKGIVVVYLDNILIFMKMEEKHEWAVWWVLEILAEHKLFLHLEKCEFHRKQIEYLELVISENKVEMDFVKVARVYDWPTLENQTNVQAFIGFINFYHWWGSKGLITKQRWKWDQRGKISKLLYNCALNK